MDQDDPTVESSHDLDEGSNVTTSATEPSPTGDVVAAHDDIPNNGHDIAGASENASDITIQEYADSIKDLHARLRASYGKNQDAREDVKRAERSEDQLRTQLDEEIENKRALRAEHAQSHQQRMALEQECDNIRNELNDRKCTDVEHMDLQEKLDISHQELSQLQLQHEQLTLMYETYKEENVDLSKRLSGNAFNPDVELTTIERHAASLVRRATLHGMPSQPEPVASSAQATGK